MFSKIKDWFLDKYVDLILFLNRKKIERDLEKEITVYETYGKMGYILDETERAYSEGIATMKKKVRDKFSESKDQ